MEQAVTSSIGPRFSIRFALTFITVVAVCLVATKNSDWVSGVGLFIAYVVIVVGRCRPKWPLRRSRLVLSLAVAAVIGWFVAVDRFLAIEHCRFCNIHHRTDEFRLLGFSLSKRQFDEHGNMLNRIANDLGKPCRHDYERMPLVRLWGLLYCARPCIGITCCLGAGDDNYDQLYHERVVLLGRTDPKLAQEFHDWLQFGDQKDVDYFRSLRKRLDDLELPE